jgi:hypothetical protein
MIGAHDNSLDRASQPSRSTQRHPESDTKNRRMNRKLRLVIVLTGGLCCSPTMAGERFHSLMGCDVPDCVGQWFCPDYCPKKQPCVWVPPNFCCDDYCPKREPSVCVPLRFCCDDYCPKCPPKACSPPLCENLRCGPPRASGSFIAGAVCTSCETAIADGRRHSNVRGVTKVTITGADAKNAEHQSFWGRLISHRKSDDTKSPPR